MWESLAIRSSRTGENASSNLAIQTNSYKEFKEKIQLSSHNATLAQRQSSRFVSGRSGSRNSQVALEKASAVQLFDTVGAISLSGRRKEERSLTKILVVTGAGISKNAGIPTYRESGNSWVDKDLERISRADRYGNYLDRLKPIWLERSRLMDAAKPTVFHQYLSEIPELRIATQNVDGLDFKAGSDPIEIHGSILFWRKLRRDSPLFHYSEIMEENGKIYHPVYGERIRPDVVLFGERVRRFEEVKRLAKSSDLTIFAGTSLEVYPVASLLLKSNCSVVVNPNPIYRTADQVFLKDADCSIEDLERVRKDLL